MGRTGWAALAAAAMVTAAVLRMSPAVAQSAPQDPRVAACVLRGGTPADCAAALGPPRPAPATAAPAQAANCAQAETHWKSAEEIKSLGVYQDHLARFPSCAFAALARARIGQLGGSPPAPAAAAPTDQARQPGPAWLGVFLAGDAQGAKLTGVDELGPAKAAGLVRDDVIVRLDGQDIKTVDDVIRRVAGSPVGKQVEIVFIRNGVEQRTVATLSRREDVDKLAGGDSDVQETMGLHLANISAVWRQRFKIKDGIEGVVVTGIDPGSPATRLPELLKLSPELEELLAPKTAELNARKPLAVGDVIVAAIEVRAEFAKVSSAAQLRRLINERRAVAQNALGLKVIGADGVEREVALNLKSVPEGQPSQATGPRADQVRLGGRAWLGVRLQEVTGDIARSLKLGPPRGALVADVDPRGPAKPGGIEAGDVIVRFDGQDIKTMTDLPVIVGDTPAGKDVEVVVFRSGRELTKRIKLARFEDDGGIVPVTPSQDAASEPRTVVQKALGLVLADMTDELRGTYKIKDSVKGVVITGVDAGTSAAEKRLSPGDVVMEAGEQEVATAADLRKRIDQVKKDGRKTILLAIANADGELRYVALRLE